MIAICSVRFYIVAEKLQIESSSGSETPSTREPLIEPAPSEAEEPEEGELSLLEIAQREAEEEEEQESGSQVQQVGLQTEL